MKRRLVIAIDGPAGSGKSSAAKKLSDRLNYTYIDSGAMYRALALKCIQQGVPLENEEMVSAVSESIDILFRRTNTGRRTFLDGDDVTLQIRDEPVSLGASTVARYKAVRDTLTARQQKIGKGGGVVMEGRDIGTVVFPDADIKIFLSATAEERAKRRFTELRKSNLSCDYEMVLKKIRERDLMDSSRSIAPLKPARDATIIDTTHLSFDEVLESMLKLLA